MFSSDGQNLASSRCATTSTESRKTRLVLVLAVDDPSSHVHKFNEKVDDPNIMHAFTEKVNGEGSWDARPTGIVWSIDGSQLLAPADKHARGILWELSRPRRRRERTSWGASRARARWPTSGDWGGGTAGCFTMPRRRWITRATSCWIRSTTADHGEAYINAGGQRIGDQPSC